jgi:hypothetical protein
VNFLMSRLVTGVPFRSPALLFIVDGFPSATPAENRSRPAQSIWKSHLKCY